MSTEKELPEGWIEIDLGELCQIVSGNTPKELELVCNTGNIDFYKVSDMNLLGNEISMRSSKLRLSREEVAKLKIKLYPKGTVIFPKRGGAILTNKKRLLSKESSFDLNIMGILPNDKVASDYLFYWFQKLDLGKICDGSNVPQINNKNINPLKFQLPPISEQHQIVEKIEELFSELDKGIENLKTAQQQLKIYRQAVLKWAFEGKLTNDNLKDGELPKRWKLKKVADIADINPKIPNKESIPYSMAVQFLPMKLVEEVSGKINLTEFRLYGEVKKGYTPFINDDVIFAKVTPCMENGKIAVVDKLKNGIGFGSSEFHVIRSKGDVRSQYLFNFLVQERFRSEAENSMTGAVGLRRVPKQFIENYLLPVPPADEQDLIIQGIESRLTVCDKIEETITNSLQQAEALRQSILKKAFEGNLVKTQDQPAYKPKNTYFYQMQLLGIVAAASKEKGINHGEMTIAKFAYLLDKVYQIPTFYDYKRWHLGPYPPNIKKAINNAQFFTKKNNWIEVKDISTLTKYTNPYTDKLKNAVDDLSDIFAKYTGQDRSHQIELLATVVKVIEDIQSTDLKTIRASMAEWKIDLATTYFKNKAEKFSEEETDECLQLIKRKNWHSKILTKDE